MNAHTARLHGLEWLAEGVLGLDFRPVDGQPWAAVTAGAHIDLRLPGGLVRSYSLVNAPGETHRYLVAVHQDPNSRGGSRTIHQALRPGEKIEIVGPRNSFALREEAAHTVFVAGGIGVTPLWCMAQRLSQIGRPWTMHYCARSMETAAYARELQELAAATGNTLHLHLDGGDPARRADLGSFVAEAPAGSHFYCCGPAPMLKAYSEATSGLDSARVHLEYFAPPPAPAAGATGSGDRAFTLKLSRSGKLLNVPVGQSVLDVLLGAGIEVPYSCMAGICRACETKVVEGTVDHRDMVLEDAERNRGDCMIICCSRASSDALTLEM